MIATTTPEVMDLAKSYARYFVEDTAYSIVQHLSGSYPIDHTQIKDFIAKQTIAQLDEANMGIGDVNVCTRFLYECASHALTDTKLEADSRQAWEKVKALPSIHHTELGAMVYSQANLYKKTIDRTLMGVITKDAYTAAESIRTAIQAREQYTETGGTVQTFGWGILGDGLWLNGAILRAFDLASIFHPNEPVMAHYTETAFSFAHQYAHMDLLDTDAETLANGELSVLIASSPNSELTNLINEFGASELSDLLFAPVVLDRYVSGWERGTVDASRVVANVKEMSIVARILTSLIDTARNTDNEIISDHVKQRLFTASDVVTLALMGYEALRETRFNEALILSVMGQGQDPKVDVIVNKDMMSGFMSSGGEESDLVHFGLYLDPRTNRVPVSNTGWTLQHVLDRRDEVIPQMMAENQDRLERLRNNDAAAIIASAQQIINPLVNRHMEACGLESITSKTHQAVNDVIRAIVDPNSDQQLDMAIADILLKVRGDSFLEAAFESLMTYSTSPVQQVKDHAKSMTVAAIAVTDLVDFICRKDAA